MSAVAAGVLRPEVAVGLVQTHASARAVLGTLQTLLGNIVRNPSEPKYRSIRTTNPKIAELLAVPGARDVLLGFGFADDGGEHLVIPASAVGDARVLDLIGFAVIALDAPATVVAADPAREKELAAAHAKRDREKAEREAILELARKEREEKKRADAAAGPIGACSARGNALCCVLTGPHHRCPRHGVTLRVLPPLPAAGPSIAHSRAFGSKATTYKDVGVDLNSKGG